MVYVARKKTQFFASNKVKEILFIWKNTPQNILMIGRKLQEADTQDNTGKHRLNGNTGNMVNQFITIVKPNLHSYSNELIKFSETTTLIYKTGFYLQYHKMNYYELPTCYPRENIQHLLV